MDLVIPASLKLSCWFFVLLFEKGVLTLFCVFNRGKTMVCLEGFFCEFVTNPNLPSLFMESQGLISGLFI